MDHLEFEISSSLIPFGLVGQGQERSINSLAASIHDRCALTVRAGV